MLQTNNLNVVQSLNLTIVNTGEIQIERSEI